MESSENSFGKRYFIFLMVFLGALSAFGPFITDFYLPTLPSMATIFHTTPSMVQLGLTASMLGLAIGQLFFGPISDKYGRRPVLAVSLVIFAISTFASLYSPNIEFFNVCRFLQGLGGAGGIVMSRSVATDCYSGRELAKILAIVGAINGVAPVAAPVIGGLVAKSIGWKGIFMILLIIGVVLFLLCGLFRESLPKEKRFKGNLWRVAGSFVRLLHLPYFCVYVVMYGFSFGVLFSYISSASFIVQDHFGYSELFFSLVFATNAIGIAVGSGLTLKFKKMPTAALFSAAGMTIVGVGLLLAVLFADSFWLYEGLTFVILFFLGFMFPSGTTLAMDEGRSAIGAASAICGAIGFVFGGAVSPLVGLGDLIVTSSAIILASSVLALGFAIVAYRRKADKN